MKIKLLVLTFLIFFGINLSAQEVIDKIAAVVDNEIISLSELQFQINLYAQQHNLDPNAPELKQQILTALIEDKLAYAQAIFDSVTVSDEEINQRLDYQIDMFKQQYGSNENIEKAYGMPIEKIRKELKDNVSKSLIVQKLQEKNFGNVSASKREVEEFFNANRDSIGLIPEKVRISHIFRTPKSSEATKEIYKKKAQDLLDSIKAGADFAELARKYSDDPGSASKGGDLGFVKRGVFYPEFESAAFELKNGGISNVVESQVGFHIIQLLERRGDAIHTRHILIKIQNDKDADIRTIEFLSDIKDSIDRKKGSFKDFARKYSEDKETAVFGGEIGDVYTDQLDKNMVDVVSKLNSEEISYPKRIDYAKDIYGYHIVYLEKRTPRHAPNLTDDYTDIEKLTIQHKKADLYKKWIEEVKKKIYWEVRI